MWWEDLKQHIYESEGDGQSFMRIYYHKNHGYALVTYADDGIPVEAIELKGGKAKELDLT